MKTALATLMTLALAGTALAQSVIYSNAGSPSDTGLAPSSATLSGVAAPAGLLWSEASALGSGPTRTEASAVAGFAGYAVGSGHYRFADDFVIPPTTGGWRIDGATLYAYIVGTPGSPAFTSATLRIWRSSPADVGSTLAFGDDTTNRLQSSALTNIRRVFSTASVTGAPAAIAPDTSRPIYQIALALPSVTLTPGTYWLDWQLIAAADAPSFTPPITIPGQRAKGGANALHLRLAPPPDLVDQWLPLIDMGKPASAPDAAQDLPFLLSGAVLPAPCGQSDVAGANQSVGPDGALTADDIIVFLGWYFAADTRADVAGANQSTTPDSAFTADDIIVFLGRYFSGC